MVVTSPDETVAQTSSVLDVTRAVAEHLDALQVALALREVPGLYLRTNSRNEALVTIRGFDQRQIAVFVDGVPISLPHDGLIDMSQLSIAPVAKITTTRGISSVLYGPNSMGGTINIVTEEGHRQLQTLLRLQAGSEQATTLSLGGTTGWLGWFASGQYRRSSDFPLPSDVPPELEQEGARRANSSATSAAAFAKLEGRFGDAARLTLSLSHTDAPKGVPTNIYTARPRYWSYTDWRKTILTLSGEVPAGSAMIVKGALFYQRYYNVLNSYDDATLTSQDAPYAFRSVYDDDSFGLNVTAVAWPADLSLKIAALARSDTHREQGDADRGVARYTANTYSLGVEQDVRITSELRAVFGLNYDHLHPSFAAGGVIRNDLHAWGGHGGMVWDLPGMRLHAHLGLRSRFPTLKELYSENLGRNLPNRDLGSERTWSAELGWSASPLPELEIHASGFASSVRGLIQNVFLDGGLRQLQNLGTALFRGVEVSSHLRWRGHSLDIAYTFLESRNTTEGASSTWLEHRPGHVLATSADVALPLEFGLRAELTYVGAQHSMNLDDGSWQFLDSYWLLNLRGSFTPIGPLELFVRLQNLTDTYYETEYGYPQPGRTFIAGVCASL